MGVGGVTSMNSMSSVQMTMARSADVKSKKIKNEISDVQQRMQKLSSDEELSVDEKANERKKQKKEIADLNTELRRHQDELLISQKREIMMAKLQKKEGSETKRKSADEIATDETNKNSVNDKETKTLDNDVDADNQGTVIFKNSDGTVILKGEMNRDEERSVDENKNQINETKEKGSAEKESKAVEDDTDKDPGMSGKEIHAIISADASAQQLGLRGTAIARIRGGIAVLKGEIEQDERYGVNTDKKQAELEKLQKKEEKAITFPFSSALDEENRAIRAAAKIKVSGTQSNTENKAIINVSKLSKEEVPAV